MERGLEVDAIDRHKHVTSGRFIYQHSRDFTGAEWLPRRRKLQDPFLLRARHL